MFYMWKPSDKCFSVINENELQLWHQKLGHMNVKTTIKLVNQEVVQGIPKFGSEADFVCGPCIKGKQVKVKHKSIEDIQNKNSLDLIHIDLMGPMQVESIAGKKYVFVLVDDYTRYT